MAEHAWPWVEALGHWALSWSVVVAAVALWAALARPRRASVRYAGWLLATFAGAALVPIVLAVGPRVSWRDLVEGLRPSSVTTRSPERFRPWFDGARVAPVAAMWPEAPPAASIDLDAAAQRGVGDPGAGAEGLRAAGAAGPPWPVAWIGLWAVGFSAFAARLAVGAVRVRALLRGAVGEVPAGLPAAIEEARGWLGLRRRVRLAAHPGIASPMCVGLVRPTVLWPTERRCPMTPSQSRAAAVHELAHLKHLDDWVGLAAELWRALAWFYPPVHATLGRLRREREYRCDDLASDRMGDPTGYARMLLDLSPVRVAPPVLSASLLGGSSLAGRVRRLIDGESSRSRRPLARRQLGLLAVGAAVLLAGAASVRLVGLDGRAEAVEVEPLDAPLPEIAPEELAAKLREAMARYDRGYLEVAWDETRNTNWRFARGEGTEQEREPIIVEFQGRARYLSDGRRWRAEYDAMVPNSGSKELNADRWTSGFDGNLRYSFDVGRAVVKLGDVHWSSRNWTPRQVFWDRVEEAAAWLDRHDPERSPVRIEQRTVDGVRCYVVLAGEPGDEYRGETILSPRRGFLPVEYAQFYKGRKTYSYRLFDVREVEPDLWAPSRTRFEWLTFRDDGASAPQVIRDLRVVSYDPGRTFEDDAYRLEIPLDVDVTDLREGYSYHNDPWWPEVGELLRTRFDWPKADLLPLHRLGTPEGAEVVGKPAPPIRAAEWVNADPVTWEDRRGRVTLVAFLGPGDRELLAPLRRLRELYGPAGLEVVLVHFPTDLPRIGTADDVRHLVDEFRLPFPVAIDRPSEDGPWGVTGKSFGVEGVPYAFLVDHEGIVRSAGRAAYPDVALLETLPTLLEAAGAGEVPGISPRFQELAESRRMSREMVKALEDGFRRWVDETPPAGRGGGLQGRIVDGRGLPIAGATVEARLTLITLIFADPGAYEHIRHPDGTFLAVTDELGHYTIPGLTKGTYLMKFEAAGRAWRQERASIGPGLEVKAVDVVLGQGDAIEGRVLDEGGRPVVGARVTSVRRYFEQNGNTVWTTGDPLSRGPRATDESGQFRFEGLESGRYTFKVEAEGFATTTVEQVTAGTDGVSVTLSAAGSP